jgi:hypothetical protein
MPAAEANTWTGVDLCSDVAALACYVAGATTAKTTGVRERVQALRGAAFETTRSDAKTGREGRTPFEVLSDEGAACVAAGGDMEGAFPLWFEFERAVTEKRRDVCRWTPGLSDLLGVTVATDEEAASEVETEGLDLVEQATIPADVWRGFIQPHAGREYAVRVAWRDGGLWGLNALLATWGAPLAQALE